MRDQKGQVSRNVIAGLVAMIVALLIGGMIITEFYGTAQESAPTYTYATTNSTFADNEDGWSSTAENTVLVTNAWDAGEYITTTVAAVSGNYENGIWYQSLSVSDIYTGVDSATLSLKWRLIDNENIEAVYVRIYLCDGTDNTLIYENDSVDNTTTWNTQENSVTSVVDAAGTYTVYMRAEIDPDDANTPSVIVGWDTASLTVVAWESQGLTEVGDKIPTVFKLLAILLIVVVAGIILRGLGVL